MPRGYPKNPELTRARRSQSQKDRWQDPEQREVLMQHKYGKRLDGSPASGRYVDEFGYVFLSGLDHPLGQFVAEHRAVLYDAIGEGPHQCHWNGCTKMLYWRAPRYRGIYVDHLDGNPGNNERQNLVVSCFGHNRSGARKHFA